MTLPENYISQIKAAHKGLEEAKARRSLAEMSLSQANQKLDSVKCDLMIEDRLLGGWAINNKRTRAVSDQKDAVSQAARTLESSAQEIKEKEETEQKVLAQTLLVTDEDYSRMKLALSKLTNLEISLQNLARTVNEVSPAVKKAVIVTRDELENKIDRQQITKFGARPAVVRKEAKKAFGPFKNASHSLDKDISAYNELREKLGQAPLNETFGRMADKKISEDAAFTLLYMHERPLLIKYSVAREMVEIANMNNAFTTARVGARLARAELQNHQAQMQESMVQKEKALLKQALSL